MSLWLEMMLWQEPRDPVSWDLSSFPRTFPSSEYVMGTQELHVLLNWPHSHLSSQPFSGRGRKCWDKQINGTWVGLINLILCFCQYKMRGWTGIQLAISNSYTQDQPVLRGGAGSCLLGTCWQKSWEMNRLQSGSSRSPPNPRLSKRLLHLLIYLCYLQALK